MEFIFVLIGFVIIITLLWSYAPQLLILAGIGLVVAIVIFIVSRIKNRAPRYDLSQYTIDYTINTKVAGVTFNGVQKILPTLRSGMPLSFIREPNNKYDKNAVAVFCNRKAIGHLSAELASDIAPIMDRGTPVTGKILNISGGGSLSYGCNIEVIVYKPIGQGSSNRAKTKNSSRYTPRTINRELPQPKLLKNLTRLQLILMISHSFISTLQ